MGYLLFSLPCFFPGFPSFKRSCIHIDYQLAGVEFSPKINFSKKVLFFKRLKVNVKSWTPQIFLFFASGVQPCNGGTRFFKFPKITIYLQFITKKLLEKFIHTNFEPKFRKRNNRFPP